MASGTLGDPSDDLNWRGRCRWTENSKVYTRRVHKKAQKSSNNNDTATTTIRIAENPTSAAPSTAANPTPTQAEVSSATVATTTVAEVSTASTSEGPDNCAAASPPPTSPGNLAETTTPGRSSGSPVLRESPGPLEENDVDSYKKLHKDSPQQEQSPSCGSPDKDADTLQQLLEEKLQHQPHTPSLLQDNCSTQNRVREGNGSQPAELQNLEDLSLPNSNEAENLKTPSPILSENEVNGDRPNGSEVAVQQLPTENEGRGHGEMMPGSPQVPEGNERVHINGVVKPLVISSVDDRIRFKLWKATPKNEIKDLWKKLECELDQVRRLVKQLEAKDIQLASYSTQISNSNLSNTINCLGGEGASIGVYGHPQNQNSQNNVVDRRVLVRLNSEVSTMGHQEARPMGLARVNSDMGAARNLGPRPYSRQLSVAVMENNHRAGEFVEKEKRTPKANQYYRNSEFLLGKDRLPPESNKRLKTNNRKYSGETEHAFGFGFRFEKSRNQVFKSCSSLLQRLMKHKYGWVFNEPVNAKALGLVDYHDIIKHPMDLGTIKTRLSQNWYKSPKDFAEDVRLVFHNAMTYNPKGQDVHIMAEQLLQIFEERWAIIETECNPYWKYQMYQDGGLSTPTSRKAPPQSHFTPASVPLSSPLVPGFISAATQFPGSAVPLYAPAAPQIRAYDRPEPMTSVAVDPKIHRPHVGRTPLPKKPKAKDPNKRDMTYEEKQRLSSSLQGLPSEKLDAIVQIIKKRNTALSQHDDEIEVDIDSVDPETLWELDRTQLQQSRRFRLRVEQIVPSSKAFERATAPPDEGKKQGIMKVNPAVQAAPAVILDHLQVVQVVTVPLQMDRMKGIHRGLERISLRTFGYAEWPDGTGMPFDVLGMPAGNSKLYLAFCALYYSSVYRA
ncbi:Transcription factor GTE4 [Sesamum angolense]|uniref:Transcription factor GTE4 n=1 Tax=Sesamum angolense TaxID=2727404 RepID=A0AAE1W5R0_9LAMI|nr:Transcription factor GTE4 [Sesamum angolense]